METNSRAELLGSAPIGRLMIKFSVPSIVAMLVSALYNIVDQLFIGQSVGTLGNAATNVAFPLTTSCIALSLLFGIGGASCFNLSMGRGEREKAPFFIGSAVLMLAVCGIFLMTVTELFLTPLLKFFGSPDNVLPYAQEYVRITALGFPFLVLTTGGCHLVRADGSPAMSMACNITGAVINTILDAVFVMGLGMGMKGAALATIIGQYVSGAMVIFYLRRFRTMPLTKEHFRFRFEYVKKTAAIGTASFINQTAMMIVQIVLNKSLKYYGALSVYGEEIPLACAGIVMKVNQIMFSIVIGLGQGTQPIESFNYGARRYDRVRTAYRYAVTAGFIVSLIFFAVFQIFPRQIIGMFGKGSDEYFMFGEKFFRVFLFFAWLNCVQPITTTFFTSIGKPLKGAFLSLTRQILFFLPFLVILPLYFGIDGILYTGPSADLLSAMVTLTMVILEFRAMKKLEQADNS